MKVEVCILKYLINLCLLVLLFLTACGNVATPETVEPSSEESVSSEAVSSNETESSETANDASEPEATDAETEVVVENTTESDSNSTTEETNDSSADNSSDDNSSDDNSSSETVENADEIEGPKTDAKLAEVIASKCNVAPLAEMIDLGKNKDLPEITEEVWQHGGGAEAKITVIEYGDFQ